MGLDFHWIVPGLAQGGHPEPPQSAFEVFDVVAFCAQEHQPRFAQPAGRFMFKIPLDDDIYRPIPPDVGQVLHQAAKSLAGFVASGRKVLIVCAQGVNRSGLMTALTLMYALRMPAGRAIQLIRSRRKSKDPDLYPLCNPMFEQYLLTTRLA